MIEFEKFRVSLKIPEPGPLLKISGHTETRRPRAEFLRDAFSVERSFFRERSSKEITFTPLILDKKYDGYVAGFFKCLRPAALANKDLKRYEAEHYESAFMILSISEDQIVWVQYNYRIGQAKNLIRSYLDSLAKTEPPMRDWTPQVLYTDNPEEYDIVVRARRADITRISFTYIPPNPSKFDGMASELVEAGYKQGGAETQKHIYKAPAGQMDPESDIMKANARIALDGKGMALVKGGKETIFKSGQAGVSSLVPKEDMPTPDHPDFVSRVIKWLFEKW